MNQNPQSTERRTRSGIVWVSVNSDGGSKRPTKIDSGELTIFQQDLARERRKKKKYWEFQTGLIKRTNWIHDGADSDEISPEIWRGTTESLKSSPFLLLFLLFSCVGAWIWSGELWVLRTRSKRMALMYIWIYFSRLPCEWISVGLYIVVVYELWISLFRSLCVYVYNKKRIPLKRTKFFHFCTAVPFLFLCDHGMWAGVMWVWGGEGRGMGNVSYFNWKGC